MLALAVISIFRSKREAKDFTYKNIWRHGKLDTNPTINMLLIYKYLIYSKPQDNKCYKGSIILMMTFYEVVESVDNNIAEALSFGLSYCQY
ncbi:hypothetical protein IMG5_052760 [Ichthyophthirius multifiliis]|uniref:Uncharacterized protein n=1 Tax=Ichthyophthirius multifiliis TaxID=5932 RepID=G0QMW1_ICHMU|nr:hypothetical protein IMG5_052760 [Ichthyophthirius multifiliis]EGR33442.1 hypothetical protein IMG5_052760 [Ichthyophthirius multifiliis]|eukprot:XP_004037428.1 hypothetical protein IMG5_052760 [Ichthyophthirius multifiliis]